MFTEAQVPETSQNKGFIILADGKFAGFEEEKHLNISSITSTQGQYA